MHWSAASNSWQFGPGSGRCPHPVHAALAPLHSNDPPLLNVGRPPCPPPPPSPPPAAAHPPLCARCAGGPRHPGEGLQQRAVPPPAGPPVCAGQRGFACRARQLGWQTEGCERGVPPSAGPLAVAAREGAVGGWLREQRQFGGRGSRRCVLLVVSPPYNQPLVHPLAPTALPPCPTLCSLSTCSASTSPSPSTTTPETRWQRRRCVGLRGGRGIRLRLWLPGPPTSRTLALRIALSKQASMQRSLHVVLPVFPSGDGGALREGAAAAAPAVQACAQAEGAGAGKLRHRWVGSVAAVGVGVCRARVARRTCMQTRIPACVPAAPSALPLRASPPLLPQSRSARCCARSWPASPPMSCASW